MRFFLAKNQKSFKGGKLRNYHEETEYFEKKTFFLEKHLYQNGKVQMSCSADSRKKKKKNFEKLNLIIYYFVSAILTAVAQVGTCLQFVNKPLQN